ncbi:hypothetical protein BH11CYA1_BH11CYA1_29550 [soil metagenome]
MNNDESEAKPESNPEIKPTTELETDLRSEIDESKTGLPWPTSWRGAYIFVAGTFIFWIVLLVALTRFGS